MAPVPDVPNELAYVHKEQDEIAKEIHEHRATSRDLQRVLFSGGISREEEDEMVAEIREHHRLILELQDDKLSLAQHASDLVAKEHKRLEKASEMIEKWEREER
jgi:hypothetical protein